jgi:hypothetical protein
MNKIWLAQSTSINKETSSVWINLSVLSEVKSCIRTETLISTMQTGQFSGGGGKNDG